MTPYPEDLERWRRAAWISARARAVGVRAAVPGARRQDVAEAIEAAIRSQGAEPAFPANLSRNVEAAHYTPSPDDAEVLLAGDLLKVDVGAHLDGAIADTAETVEVGGGHRHDHLRSAVRAAVEAGIAEVRAGVAVDRISRAIEGAIHARGLKPVRNLTGHTIERYLLHAGKAIPNASGMSTDRLSEGEIVAIEPFATNGAGEIENGPFGNIVRFRSEPAGTTPVARSWFERFRTLPFTARWIPAEERGAFSQVRRHLQSYPVFLERGGGLVAQWEHTVLVGPQGAEVLTRGDGAAGSAP
ncbi:MAG: type II methionyl aminopeptidase [Thermoplasmata archaeon]|nr:type II methionyl aminopeptidase [Thermoplasmata archaeon]MCI4359598.1 type II methionyl aminopeptidase [Thermoplasmata archaeon]